MIELIKRYIKPYTAKSLFGMLAKGIEVVFELLTPIVVARMIDEGVITNNTQLVINLGIVLVIFACIGYASTLITQRIAAVVSQGMGTSMRNDLFSHVLSLCEPEVSSFGTASLITRITSDINQVQLSIALFIRTFVRWPFLALGSMIAAILIDQKLGLIFAVCVPLISLVFYCVMTNSIPLFLHLQDVLDALTARVNESLLGVRVIRAFRRDEYEQQRFEHVAYDHLTTNLVTGRLSALLNPATMLIMNLSIVVILWQSGFRVQAGSLSLGEIVAFINYVTQMLLSVSFLANLIVIFTRGSASSKRIVEVFNTSPTLKSGSYKGNDTNQDSPALLCKDVSFGYSTDAEAIVSHVSFTLHRLDTLGIIGGTGAGKTTLIQLVTRILEADEGTIEVLGHDLGSWDFKALRQVISVVPQHDVLLAGTLRDNLCWRDANATDEELTCVLKIAQAYDFVFEHPQGLDQVVLSGGSNFSGGQRARLCIARALVGSPQILILDDAMSALDFATEAQIRRSLSSISCTKIIVSQRVSTIKAANQILVLNHGALAGLGTHESLLRDCTLYKEIYDSQTINKEVEADV